MKGVTLVILLIFSNGKVDWNEQRTYATMEECQADGPASLKYFRRLWQGDDAYMLYLCQGKE